jgi:hypothetical protein
VIASIALGMAVISGNGFVILKEEKSTSTEYAFILYRI